ncbi:gamma-glutamyl phosphate reductase [Synechococcus sp. W55.1]|uniref:gamma-glutamyl phosphate reductase n=1 Tax=Synechococcus sp. W55.1 TaxID=2964512 RepID=UPI0039C158CA
MTDFGSDFDLGTTLRQVRRLLPQLQRLSSQIKRQALLALSRCLLERSDLLLEANTLDLESCREQTVPEWILNGLKLTPERLQRSAQLLTLLAQQPDPIGKLEKGYRQENGLFIGRYRVPLGLIALVYEIYPEFALNGIGMCLKAGNGVILASSGPIQKTHQAMVNLLAETAYEHGIPEGAIQTLPAQDRTADPQVDSPLLPLLQQTRYLDLVIPCGRPGWVEFLLQASKVPTLATHLGYGHIYLDRTAPWPLVKSALLDPLAQYGSEGIPIYQPLTLWLLIHTDWAANHLTALVEDLLGHGIAVQAAAPILEQFPQLQPLGEGFDSTERPHLRLQPIADLTEAIAWINKNGCRQSETILTDSQSAAQRFLQEVDAALIHINTSPLSAGRGAGIPTLGAFRDLSLGISTQRLHVRGPIDVEALTTVKVVAQGDL